ncbi:MAG: stage sporulation protein [Eubacteriales bacterium]|nr:stage sporulation protein [Eubacteriales bacterium]
MKGKSKVVESRYFGLLISAAVYTFSILVGYISGKYVLFVEPSFFNRYFLSQTNTKITWLAVITHNTLIILLIAIGGLLSFGIVSAAILFSNGFYVGLTIAFALTRVSITYILKKLLPHGIIEIPALLIASSMGFRLLQVVLLYVFRRDSFEPNWKWEVKNFAIMLIISLLLLLCASVVEVFVSQ